MSKCETVGQKFKIMTFQVKGALLCLPELAVLCPGANICCSITSQKYDMVVK